MVRERVKFINDMANCRFEVGDAPTEPHSALLGLPPIWTSCIPSISAWQTSMTHTIPLMVAKCKAAAEPYLLHLLRDQIPD